jgi:hypothetical protein
MKTPAAVRRPGSKTFTDCQPENIQYDQFHDNCKRKTPDGAPTPLGAFLAALANGPLLNSLRINVGASSVVRARYARWVAAKNRADLTKFPALPE